MAGHPTTTNATGKWSLRQVAKFESGGLWPPGTFFTISETIPASGTVTGSVFNVGETGEFTLTPLTTFTATVKIWGAGGAGGFEYTQTAPGTADFTYGGGGGYTTATVEFQAGTTYILQIGEKGSATAVASVAGATYEAGGIGNTNSYGGTEGGGYSGIFVTSVSQANALLIAGGGGGGGDSSYSGGVSGGAGGGISGGNAGSAGTQGGYGGTQSAGGAPSQYNNATAGSALTGGLGQQTYATHSSQGGGGGGYYGGGGGNVAGGGGGSGFVSTNSAVTNGVTITGSGGTPANSSSSDRNGSGQGGYSTTVASTDGRIIIEVQV